jgi:hypothetical protein
MSNVKSGLSAAGAVLLVFGVVRLSFSSPASEALFVLVATAIVVLTSEALSALRRMLRGRHASLADRYQRDVAEIRRLRTIAERDSARRRNRQGDAPGTSGA